MVEHPGRLLTHHELLDALWPNTHVQAEVLKTHIFEVRTALGDDSKKPLFIETLPRRGYRFIAPVTEGAAPALPVATATGRLVGRERPLAVLREALQRAVKGERQLVFVTGEPGIGKTALVDEFQRQAALDIPDLRIGRGQCIEAYGSKEAYYPMLVSSSSRGRPQSAPGRRSPGTRTQESPARSWISIALRIASTRHSPRWRDSRSHSRPGACTAPRRSYPPVWEITPRPNSTAPRAARRFSGLQIPCPTTNRCGSGSFRRRRFARS